MAIRNILWPFWYSLWYTYIFSRFGMLYQEKIWQPWIGGSCRIQLSFLLLLCFFTLSSTKNGSEKRLRLFGAIFYIHTGRSDWAIFAHWAIVYFGHFFEVTKGTYALIFTKMGWATFWAIFSQAYLVTLKKIKSP
jgi:hypothetical protein